MPERQARVHRWITRLLQGVLLLGLCIAAWNGRWMTVFLVAAILLLTFWPVFVRNRFSLSIPPEFELVAIGFVFATLFLGEVHGYYARFAWWDAALHLSSGFLLGVLGFLLVYVLNQDEAIQLRMNPTFMGLFAFAFALAVGAVWEIFEFAVDSLFGLNMQKSGLVDTMWDLILDTVGAACIALAGSVWMAQDGRHSFLEEWIDAFVEANPQLFRRA